MTATEQAAALVRDWGNDFRDVRKLPDQALGELIRRIATALSEQSKS